MKLTIPERVTLLGVLPQEGNFVTLTIVRQLRERLSFTEDDLAKFSITEDNGRINFNPSVEPDGVDIECGEKATDIIVDALKKLDEASKLEDRHFTLYEKFVVTSHAG